MSKKTQIARPIQLELFHSTKQLNLSEAYESIPKEISPQNSAIVWESDNHPLSDMHLFFTVGFRPLPNAPAIGDLIADIAAGRRAIFPQLSALSNRSDKIATYRTLKESAERGGLTLINRS